MSMNPASPQSPNLQGIRHSADLPYKRQPWYGAYMAALFEADRKQIRERIKYAEVMIARQQELLGQSSEFTEKRALNHALHALRALWSCLNL